MSETGRESFESAAESLRDDIRHAYTDDELDRLQTRSPPIMQRSRTEQDWNTAVEHLNSLPINATSLLDDELEVPHQTDTTHVSPRAALQYENDRPSNDVSTTPPESAVVAPH